MFNLTLLEEILKERKEKLDVKETPEKPSALVNYQVHPISCN